MTSPPVPAATPVPTPEPTTEPAPEPAPAAVPARRAGLAAATGWSALGVALAGLTRFAYSAVVLRLDGAAALAAVNSAIALALLAGLLGPTPLGNAAAKFVGRRWGAGDPGGAAAVWRGLVGRGAVLSAACAALGGLVAVAVLGRTGDDGLAVAAVVLGLAVYGLARGGSFAVGGFRRAAVAEAVAAGLTLGLLVVVLLTAGAGAPASLVVLPLALGYAAYAVVAWPRWGRRPTSPSAEVAGSAPSAAREELAEAPRFVGWGVLGGVASAGLLQLSVVVAAAVDAPERAGAYAAAIAVGTPVALLAVPLSQALFATLAQASGGGDEAAVRGRTDAATRALVVLMVAAGGGLVLVPRTALAVVGPGLADAVPLLQVVALAVLVSTLTVPAVASLTSDSGSGVRRVALMSGTGLVVGATTMAVCSALGAGVAGVAAGYAAGTVVTNALAWRAAWTRHRLPWRGLTLQVAGALAVLVVLVLLRHAVPGMGSVAGEWATGLAFAAAWLATQVGRVRALLTPQRPSSPA